MSLGLLDADVNGLCGRNPVYLKSTPSARLQAAAATNPLEHAGLPVAIEQASPQSKLEQEIEELLIEETIEPTLGVYEDLLDEEDASRPIAPTSCFVSPALPSPVHDSETFVPALSTSVFQPIEPMEVTHISELTPEKPIREWY